MSEKTKMLSGQLYDPNIDKILVEDRKNVKALCTEFNQIPSNDRDSMVTQIKKILGKTNGNFWIEQTFFCDYGYNIEIGDNFYSNHNLVILDAAKVTFGDNVFIGPNCGFYTAEHPLDAKTRISGLETARPIVVEDNVWFGGNVVVLAGVTIGKNSVVGAGSVVTKDIPNNVVAVGNPCKVIKVLE